MGKRSHADVKTRRTKNSAVCVHILGDMVEVLTPVVPVFVHEYVGRQNFSQRNIADSCRRVHRAWSMAQFI